MSFKFIQKIINALRLHLSKDVLWEHYKKYKEFEDTKDSVKTLILGSSHGAYGYIAKGDEYNLSLIELNQKDFSKEFNALLKNF